MHISVYHCVIEVIFKIDRVVGEINKYFNFINILVFLPSKQFIVEDCLPYLEICI